MLSGSITPFFSSVPFHSQSPHSYFNYLKLIFRDLLSLAVWINYFSGPGQLWRTHLIYFSGYPHRLMRINLWGIFSLDILK